MTDIPALRALVEKATRGPFDACGLGRRWAVYPTSSVDDGIDYFIARTCSIEDKAKEKANALLLAGAATALPSLLDEVERLRAQLDATLNTLGLMADAYPLGSATRNTLEEECRDIRAALTQHGK